MFVRTISKAPRRGGLAACRPAGALVLSGLLAGVLLLCLHSGQAMGQSERADIKVITPPAPVQAGALASPVLNLPAQIFDTPKPGRWPGSPARTDGALKTDQPKTGAKPAPAAPAAAPPVARPVGQAGPSQADQPAQAVQPPRPAQPVQTVQPVQPATPAVPAVQETPIPPPQQSGGGVPLQVTIPPPGSAPAVSVPATTPPRGTGQSAAPAGGAPVSLPASALYGSGTAPAATPPATPAATPAGPATPSVRPPSPGAPTGRPAVSQPSPGQTAPARTTAPQAVPSQAAPSQAAPAQPAAGNSGGSGQPGGSSEIPRLNFEGMAPSRPTPAPVARPASRPPTPGPGLVDMVMPGALPELEPFDENSPEAMNFDAGRALGIRDDSTSPLQRFGDSIPNFTRDEITARQQEDQESFTYNRGPAGQMGN